MGDKYIIADINGQPAIIEAGEELNMSELDLLSFDDAREWLVRYYMGLAEQAEGLTEDDLRPMADTLQGRSGLSGEA